METQLTAGVRDSSFSGMWHVSQHHEGGNYVVSAYAIKDPKGRIWKVCYGIGSFKRSLVLMELLASAYQDGKEAERERNVDA